MRVTAWPSALGIVTVLWLVACAPAAAPPTGGSSPAGSAPPPIQRTLVIAIRTEPPSLADRPFVSTTPVLDAVPLFNAELDRYNERGETLPFLAEELPKVGTDSWRVLPDGGMETTYKLKPNLTWHDGQPLTSDDFVFAWHVYSTPDLGASKSLPNEPMAEVAARDPQTFTIRWKQIYADADKLYTGLPPLPQHILQKDFANLDPSSFPNLPYWTTDFVGVGPYKLTHWEAGTFIEAEAFSGFVLGKPKIDSIKAQVIPDANTAVANLLSGAVHYVGQYVLAPDNVPDLEARWGSDGGVIQYSPVDLRGGWIQQRPDFANPQALLDLRVRRALAYAFDKAPANDELYFGRAVLADSCDLSPSAPYYSQVEPSLVKYSYDPRMSQQLMEQAGFSKGPDGLFTNKDGSPMEINVADLASTQNDHEAAAVVDGLHKTGFNTQINVLSANATRDLEAQAKLPALFVQGCGATLTQILQFTSAQVATAANHWSGRNRMDWVSADFDRAYDAFSQALNPSDRISHIAEMHHVLSDQLPVTPYWLRPVITAHVKELKGPLVRQTAEVQYATLAVWQWEWQQ